MQLSRGALLLIRLRHHSRPCRQYNITNIIAITQILQYQRELQFQTIAILPRIEIYTVLRYSVLLQFYQKLQ